VTDDKPDTKATQETRDFLNAISPPFPASARKIAAEKATESATAESVVPPEDSAAASGDTTTDGTTAEAPADGSSPDTTTA
jgi:hypothetical protein